MIICGMKGKEDFEMDESGERMTRVEEVEVETRMQYGSIDNSIMRLLPREIVLKIFSYLDVMTLCRCAQVNSMWNAYALDGCNWKAIDVFKYQSNITDKILDSLVFRSGPFLQQLILRDCKLITDDSFRNLSLNCRNLNRLDLSGCSNIEDGACLNIGLQCTNLQHLNLSSCSNVSDLSIVSISIGCESLQSLDVSWCLKTTDRGLENVFRKFRNLKTFACKFCSQYTDQGLESLSNCTTLKSIDMHNCDKVTDVTLMKISSSCGLENLCLSGCCRLTDLSLVCLANNCFHLRNLDVSRCRRVTDSGVNILAKNCHNLRRLDLEECSKITDGAIYNLTHYCQRLTHLNLAFCDLISDEGVRHIGNSACSSECLSVLELDNLSQITDVCLAYLYGCQNLKRIELIDCQYITPAGINRLMHRLPGLKVHAYFAHASINLSSNLLDHHPPLLQNNRRRPRRFSNYFRQVFCRCVM